LIKDGQLGAAEVQTPAGAHLPPHDAAWMAYMHVHPKQASTITHTNGPSRHDLHVILAIDEIIGCGDHLT